MASDLQAVRRADADRLFIEQHGKLAAIHHAASGWLIDQRGRARLAGTLLTCPALKWLNPHVYLDTLALLGTISTQFGGQRSAFAAEGMSSSFLFFLASGHHGLMHRSPEVDRGV